MGKIAKPTFEIARLVPVPIVDQKVDTQPQGQSLAGGKLKHLVAQSADDMGCDHVVFTFIKGLSLLQFEAGHERNKFDMWPVYVINMRDHKTRMDSAKALLDRLSIPFERFEAIDGRALDEASMAKFYDSESNRRRFRHPLVPGEIGVYLSHWALWSEIAKSDLPGAIVLEDDFATDGTLPEVLEALSIDSDDWDVVKLYSRKPGRKVISERPLDEGHGLSVPWQVPTTTLGYAIRREAAVKLLAREKRFCRPVDEDLRRVWEHRLDIRLVRPPPLCQGNEAKAASSVEAERKSGRARSLAQGWRNLKYRLSYLFRLYLYRRLGI